MHMYIDLAKLFTLICQGSAIDLIAAGFGSYERHARQCEPVIMFVVAITLAH